MNAQSALFRERPVRIGLLDLLLVIIIASTVVIRGSWAGDPGLGWHLRAGQLMVERGAILRYDPFLDTQEPRPWVHNQWLSDVIFWKLYQWGGFALLEIFCLGVCLGAYVVVLFPLLFRMSNSSLAAILLLLLSMFVGSVQWIIRPVVVSFLFFALVYRILVVQQGQEALSPTRAERWGRRLLPLLFFLWANLHPAFVLGLALVIFHLVSMMLSGSLRDRKFRRSFLSDAFIFGCSLLATLANPFGLDLYRHALGLGSSEFFMNLNKEWFAADFHTLLFMPFGISICLMVFCALRAARLRLGIFHILTVSFFLFMSLMHRRYIPFYSIISALVLLIMLQPAKGEGAALKQGRLGQAVKNLDERQQYRSRCSYSVALWLLLVFAVVVNGKFPWLSDEHFGMEQFYPVGVFRFFCEEKARGPVFHTPDWGGYFTWSLWPEMRPFIDDRNEVNGKQRYVDFLSAWRAEPGWRDVLEKYGFQWLAIDSGAPLRRLLEGNPLWRLVYEEGGNRPAAVFERREDSEETGRGGL